MKNRIGLLWITLLAGSIALCAGCTEEIDIDRKDPHVEIPASRDRIIAVMDKRSGERRAEEPVVLRRMNDQGTEVTSEVGEFVTNASGEFEAALDAGFYQADFAYTPGLAPDVFYRFEVEDSKLYYLMLIEDPDADFDPHDVVITLLDAKTGLPWPDKEFFLYQQAKGGGLDSLGCYVTGSEGSVTLEQKLLKGAYCIKAAYYPHTRAQAYQSQEFRVGRKESNFCTLRIEPILFAENLSWQKPAWNLINTSGVLQSVKPDVWYTYNADGSLASGGVGSGQRCDMPRMSDVEKAVANNAEWRDEYIERRHALDSTGLEFGGPYGILFFNGDSRNPACWSLALPSGAISGSGGIKLPASEGAPETFDMKVSLLANPGHKYVSNAWVVEATYNNNVDVEMAIEGGGYFLNERQEQVSTMVFDNPSVMDTPPIAAPDHWNPIEAVVHEATPRTRILLKGVGKTKVRLLIADIELVEIY